MPRFLDDKMEINNIKGTSFTYSAAKLETLGATEYTLVTIVIDTSGSVAVFKDDLEKCLKEIVNACRKSPRADNLMIRLISFNNKEHEEHGYKLLTECNSDDYIGLLKVGGMTALFDATYNAIIATTDYALNLNKNDFNTNAILFVITDGCDNASSLSSIDIEKLIIKMTKDESIESFVSVLIGVNIDSSVDIYLNNFHKDAKFTQYITIEKADAKSLAKLAAFVSRSISSQSNSLGTGCTSNQNSLTI